MGKNSAHARRVVAVVCVAIPLLTAPAALAHEVGGQQPGAQGNGGQTAPGGGRPDACGRPGSELVLSRQEAREGRSYPARECDLTGVTVRVAEAASLVPERGMTVAAFASGTHQDAELLVANSSDGTVTAGEPGSVGNQTIPTGPFNCGGSAYATYSGNAHRHNSTYYKLNHNSYPRSITEEQWVEDVRASSDTWRYGRNRCGFAQGTPAGLNVYESEPTNRFANISDSAACQSNDGTSVVSAGDLPGSDATGGTYGYACIWWQGNAPYDLVEGDIKIDGYNWSWVAKGTACNNRLHLPSAVTHEFGHFVGLRHVSEDSNGTLVMSPLLGRCEFNQSLGEGDMRGRDYLY